MNNRVFWITLSIWFVFFWSSALSFHYFPWNMKEHCWWYLPHILTIILSSVGILKVCVLIEEYYLKREVQKHLEEIIE